MKKPLLLMNIHLALKRTSIFLFEEVLLPLLKVLLGFAAFWYPVIGLWIGFIDRNLTLLSVIQILGVGIVGLYSYVGLDDISNRILSKKYISQDSNSYYKDLLIGLSTAYLTKKRGTMPTDKEINDEVKRRWKWIESVLDKYSGEERFVKMQKLFCQEPPDDFRI